MIKKWEYYNTDEKLIKKISKEFNISEITAQILINRGIKKTEEIKVFLEPTRNDFHDPFLFKQMNIAVDRIIKAIENKEKVIIYGDYDVDGITSITILKKFLQEIGLETNEYIPNRLEEGYGLNKDIISELVKNKYTLMITVDCGISAIEEVEYCNNIGIDTIITDHHEQLEDLPNAFAIIDPKRKDEKYPFRDLAGVGVVFKLIQAIAMKLNLSEDRYLKYLDLVCIGTVSDIVPLINENRVITKLGFKLIHITKNIGIKEILKEIGYKKIDSNTISFGIAPRINACGRMGHQNEALQLFITQNQKEAEEITQKLKIYNYKRQEKEKEILVQAMQKLEQEDIENINSIILSGNNWHHGVIGIVASKLTEKFFKPTILICFDGQEGKGSGRSIPGFDLHEALIENNKYLIKYGGHAMAVRIINKKR